MTGGREYPVCQNGAHEAWPCMFPNGHSVTSECNYLCPLSALCSAWKLRGEVLFDCSEGFEDSFLHHHSANPFVSASANSSVRRKHMRVHFDDYMELAIGQEDGQILYLLHIAHDVLQNWTEKPWNYFPKPPSRRFSWRKLQNLQYQFCDFSRCCEDNAEEAIGNERQINSNRYFSNPSKAAVDAKTCPFSKWILDLLDFISAKELVAEVNQRGYEVPVLSWLVDHELFPVCTLPRVVLLSANSYEWQEKVFATWSDVIGINSLAQVNVVQPDSVRTITHGCAAEIIVTARSTVHSILVDVQVDLQSKSDSITFAAESEDPTSIHDIMQTIFRKNDGLETIASLSSRNMKLCRDRIHVYNGAFLNITIKEIRDDSSTVKARGALQDITNLPVGHAKIESHVHVLDGAPQSLVAVLSSPACSVLNKAQGSQNFAEMNFNSTSDEISAVQIARPVSLHAKRDPFDFQQENMMQAFQGGQAYQGDDNEGFANEDMPESDGYSPSEEVGPTDIHSPSSEENRQDVLLFHLDEHPVHALINWNSYEDMMLEIAHHFALDKSDLIDAYEVVIQPPDIGHETVPTIVHVQDDVRPDSGDRLVLLSIEYHAHRMEANFRLGPSVVRKVLPISRNAHRNEVLARANIDRYCRAESGRCLVFINSRRWPDYDLDRKTISHGDYIRIAVPPSDRFSCPTTEISDMTQRGLTDQQIYDEMFHDEAE
jgi:hypothetical protein